MGITQFKLSDIKTGDIVVTKKNHPCGNDQWVVLHTGADFKLQCKGCSHTVILPSESVKKSVKYILEQNN